MIPSILSECAPLSLNEAMFLTEQTILIDVIVCGVLNKAMDIPLIGTLGPFVKGDIIQVPLYTVRFLADEGIAFPDVPDWLEEDTIPLLVQQEREHKELRQCPHPNYIELGSYFKHSPYNPWSGSRNPSKARETSLQLLEELIALRRRKIIKLIGPFVKERGMVTTLLSNLERRRLGLIGVEYLKKLEAIGNEELEGHHRRESVDYDDEDDYDESWNIEDLMHNMNFDMEEHFGVLEEAQRRLELNRQERGSLSQRTENAQFNYEADQRTATTRRLLS